MLGLIKLFHGLEFSSESMFYVSVKGAPFMSFKKECVIHCNWSGWLK